MYDRKEAKIKVNMLADCPSGRSVCVVPIDFRSAYVFYRREICGFFVVTRLVCYFISEVTNMNITSHSIITDAHMHLPVNYPSIPEKRDALLREMQKNGVLRGVVISDSELESSIGSLMDCAELFKDHADIAVVGGISPYIQYEKQIQILEKYLSEGAVVGIKLFCGHEPIFLNDSVLEPVFDLAAKYNVPVLFHTGWDNAQYTAPNIIRETAEKHPEIKLICCHCCYPALTACFEALLLVPNVFFDISSIADGDPSAFKGTLEQAIIKAPTRFIFGSDFGSCDQKAHLDFARTLQISDRERRLLMNENAGSLYFR